MSSLASAQRLTLSEIIFELCLPLSSYVGREKHIPRLSVGTCCLNTSESAGRPRTAVNVREQSDLVLGEDTTARRVPGTDDIELNGQNIDVLGLSVMYEF